MDKSQTNTVCLDFINTNRVCKILRDQEYKACLFCDEFLSPDDWQPEKNEVRNFFYTHLISHLLCWSVWFVLLSLLLSRKKNEGSMSSLTSEINETVIKVTGVRGGKRKLSWNQPTGFHKRERERKEILFVILNKSLSVSVVIELSWSQKQSPKKQSVTKAMSVVTDLRSDSLKSMLGSYSLGRKIGTYEGNQE